jgi:hypothetical protein
LPAGQSQKESFVNEVTARLDALVFAVIEGQLDTPPGNPADGRCWLVGPNPTGEWLGQAGALAAREGGQWLFAVPVDGMRIIDRATGQKRHYLGSWKAPATPALANGGAVVDTEARATLAGLLACLAEAGIIASA